MLNALGCLCLLEGFRMRSLKAITKKSWLITLSIRAWSHRPLCAVSAETKGWCRILSICLVPDQWSSITEWVKAEEKKKNKVIQPNLCCLSAESCRGQRGENVQHELLGTRDSHSTECEGFRYWLCQQNSYIHYHIWENCRIKWDQRWEASICQYLARSVCKVTFLLFQEIVSLYWAAAAVFPRTLQQFSPVPPLSQGPVLVSHGLVWEAKTNRNVIRENNFSHLLVFSHPLCLHFLHLSRQQA